MNSRHGVLFRKIADAGRPMIPAFVYDDMSDHQAAVFAVFALGLQAIVLLVVGFSLIWPALAKAYRRLRRK